jgi:uncharacterized protein
VGFYYWRVNHPLWKTALVTGASSGIGEAIVRQLAADGVPTVVVARRAERLNQLASELPGIEVLVADLVTEKGVMAVHRRLTDPARPIDLLVNNAGFGGNGKFADDTEQRAVEMIRCNVEALTRLTHAALGPMRDRNSGWILQVSSVASFQAAPSAAVYGATKAFVTSFSEALHEELRSTNVNVTALCPGLTRTEFFEASGGDPSVDAPGIMWLTPADVAKAGLRDLAKGKALSVPGLPYKAMVTISDMSPRGVVRRIAGFARK